MFFPRNDGGEQIEKLHFQSRNAIKIVAGFSAHRARASGRQRSERGFGEGGTDEKNRRDGSELQ